VRRGARALAAALAVGVPAVAAAGVREEPAVGLGPATPAALRLLAELGSDDREEFVGRGFLMLGADADDVHIALVLFERPKDFVRQMLVQTSRQKEYRPELKRLEPIESTPEGSLDEYRIRVMFVNITYRMRYVVDREHCRISWALDPEFENDLQDVEGFWELHEIDAGRTLARFGTRVDVGPAVPGFIQDFATQKNVPQTVDRTRRWVDSGGTWRP
jgi:hypothetical protein